MKVQQLLVITSYPPYGTTHHQSTVGIASCAKNTLLALAKVIHNRGSTPKITVLSEKLEEQPATYYDEDITVKRVWKRNSLTTFPLFLREVFKMPNTQHIMFQFGFSIYGKLFSLLLLPLFLFVLKLMDKKVTFVLHEVVPSAQEVAGHMHMKNSVSIAFFNLLFKTFYKMVTLLCCKVIVFEEVFKKRLNNSKNVVVIPIGIEKISTHIAKGEARKKLNLKNGFIVMTFGYFAWYKGTDWIAKAWRKDTRSLGYKDIRKKKKSPNIPISQYPNIQLIIAGGENPNRTELPGYISYSQNIRKVCKNNNVLITGFIPEIDLPLYFASSDVIVYPYRTLMGASASLAMAGAFQKPFLLSETLGEVLETKDFDAVFNKAGVSKKDYIFSLSKTSLLKKLDIIKKDPMRLNKMSEVSLAMAENRGWNRIGKEYYETIFA